MALWYGFSELRRRQLLHDLPRRTEFLSRIYNKQKHRKRIEIQESPNKPYADAIRDKTHDSTIDLDANDIADVSLNLTDNDSPKKESF